MVKFTFNTTLNLNIPWCDCYGTSDWLEEKWVCEDVIVTHWRYCPEPPKEEKR